LALGLHEHQTDAGYQSVGGGGHDHNVTSSPSPDVEDAEIGEEMIEFILDELLPGGERHVKIVFPEFKQITDVVHPIGSTDERVLKDAKNHYHALWEAKKALMLPENQPRPLELNGKLLKWDRDAEKDYMDAKAAEPGDSERRAIAEGQKMKALFDE